MVSSRVPVMVGKTDYEFVKQYSELTGIPATRVIGEAIADWINTVGKVRMEAIVGKTIDVIPDMTIDVDVEALPPQMANVVCINQSQSN